LNRGGLLSKNGILAYGILAYGMSLDTIIGMIIGDAHMGARGRT
jgi:hypothetical protein